MAVTEIHRITTTLNKALDYIQNPKKTDNKLLVSSFDCSPVMAFHQFGQTKRNADKTGGTLAFHLIQEGNDAVLCKTMRSMEVALFSCIHQTEIFRNVS